jgi:hypothetical protein
MQKYATDGQKWFLDTAQARQKLLVEVIARQTNSALGEHRDSK